jgi:hypothetical protein
MVTWLWTVVLRSLVLGSRVRPIMRIVSLNNVSFDWSKGRRCHVGFEWVVTIRTNKLRNIYKESTTLRDIPNQVHTITTLVLIL